MFLVNLTLLQLAGMLGAVSAIAVALYLLDRSRRQQVVSTLRFWVAAEQPAVAARRRHVQQPWSLLLQLAGMGLLLLAIAQPRLGGPAQAGRDHVILLDTSAWMGAASGKTTLMELARRRALAYLRALPARDRVMLVRVDAMATPATRFEPDRQKVEAAIRDSAAGATALNLDQAFAFARRIPPQAGRGAGEIVYAGPGRIAEPDPGAPPPPSNLRVLAIADVPENCGLRKIGARRSPSAPDTWEIYVSLRNYGTMPRTATLALDFRPASARLGMPRTIVGSRRLVLDPEADAEVNFALRDTAGGVVGATLTPHDGFPSDDHAEVALPAQPSLTVTVYSEDPDLLRPVLSATPRVTPVFRKPSEYRPDDSGLTILDRFIPPERPASDSIWIDPPSQGSPIPVRTVVTGVPFAAWDTAHPAAAGLRATDFKLDRASVFEAAPSDAAIGSVEGGPVIVARPSRPKIAVLGFHPALSGMRYELATPLLFANLLRWASPEIFRRSEISVDTAGTVQLILDRDVRLDEVSVTGDGGAPLPFTLDGHTLHFFSGAPGTVRVLAGDREYVYSLSLPQLWDATWTPPAGARRGVPRFPVVADAAGDLWPWLAAAGGALLLAEWLLFGRFRRAASTARPRILRVRHAALETRR
jgi:hypothetical protein